MEPQVLLEQAPVRPFCDIIFCLIQIVFDMRDSPSHYVLEITDARRARDMAQAATKTTAKRAAPPVAETGTKAAAGAVIGYARVSTAEQDAGLDAQLRDLKAAGVTRMFSEKVSSVAHRAQLIMALDYVREGDTLVVSKMDRLARSTSDLLSIVAQLEAKGCCLRILAMQGGGELDTCSPTGRLMLTLLGAVAEFERGIMLERQREGIAKAQAEGKYKGRAPTARNQAAQVEALKAEGVRPIDIARQLAMSRASVYRIIGSPVAG